MKKILLVDDEPEIRELVGDRLKERGYTLSTASDGPACIKKLEEDIPDLIIMDIMMPGLLGSTVVDMLKCTDKYQTIPIIIISAKDRGVDRNIGDVMKADVYLTKPFEMDELLENIKELLES